MGQLEPLDGPSPVAHDGLMVAREPLPAPTEADLRWAREQAAAAPALTDEVKARLRPIVEGTVVPRETGQRDAS